MAKKDVITMYNHKFPALNLSESVGKGGANKTGDVMLVQAMFQYIAKGFKPKFIGVNSADDIPEPSGDYDDKTERAIKSYQRKHIRNLLKVDGIIHPASYENRNLKRMTSPLMTITLLGSHLLDASLMNGDDDQFTGIVRMFPKLLPWIQQ